MNIRRCVQLFPLAPALACLALASTGCGGENNNTQPKTAENAQGQPTTTTSSQQETQPMPYPSATANAPQGSEYQTPGTTQGNMQGNVPQAGTGANAPGATGAATSLNDAQIAELANDVNNGEVEQARYAAEHATNPKVKQFAQRMVSAHTLMSQKMTTTLKTQHVIPTDSQQSLDLKSSAHSTLSTLKGESGSDFDRSYMEAQVREHQAALDLFDNTLIPNAQNDQLKMALQYDRPMVAEHLKMAKDILGTLSGVAK